MPQIKAYDSQIKKAPTLIPKPPAQILLCSPIGSGKTTVLINMLLNEEFYKSYFHRIIIFAPTFDRDDKWKKILKVRGLLRVTKEMKAQPTIQLWDGPSDVPAKSGKIDPADIHLDYDVEVMHKVLEEQNEYLRNGIDHRLCVIFEDVLALGLFESKNLKTTTNLATTLRHSACTVIYCVQSYKLMPRVIRVNCTNLIVFKIQNTQERRKIHEEFPMIGDFNKWNKKFEELLEKDYSFLHFNFQNPQGKQLIQNFDRFVDI